MRYSFPVDTRIAVPRIHPVAPLAPAATAVAEAAEVL
jgi:cytochrome c oxidase cbb3-type subunit 1